MYADINGTSCVILSGKWFVAGFRSILFEMAFVFLHHRQGSLSLGQLIGSIYPMPQVIQYVCLP